MPPPPLQCVLRFLQLSCGVEESASKTNAAIFRRGLFPLSFVVEQEDSTPPLLC